MDLQSSIQGNNRAVALLQAGQTRAALEVLRQTLEDLKEQFCEDSTSPAPPAYSTVSCVPLNELDASSSSLSSSPSDYSVTDLNASDTQLSFDEDTMMDDSESGPVKQTVQPVPILQSLLTTHDLVGGESFISIYVKALIISEDENDRETVSAVVLYNMALINHNRGVQRGRASLLKKALRLYRMSLEILFKSDSHSQDVNLLLLALFNNAAQIYSQRYDLVEMRHCLTCMREVLATEPDDATSEEHLSTFFMNTMLYPGEEITMAPAA